MSGGDKKSIADSPSALPLSNWRFRGLLGGVIGDFGVSWDAFWSPFRGLSRLISADFGADLGLLVVACCCCTSSRFLDRWHAGQNEHYMVFRGSESRILRPP